MTDRSRTSGRRSQILAWLPRQTRGELLAACEQRTFEVHELVYEQRGSVELVVFPLTGVFSLISTTEEGRGAEIATIGNEGLVGLPAFLEPRLPAAHRAIAQIAGDGLSMPASVFRATVTENATLQSALLGYTQALITQIAQGSVCNRLHPLQQRCVRWLLQSHDRVGDDHFLLTQEFLGQMLGARRDTVNRAAGELQRSGLILEHMASSSGVGRWVYPPESALRASRNPADAAAASPPGEGRPIAWRQRRRQLPWGGRSSPGSPSVLRSPARERSSGTSSSAATGSTWRS